jgi:hypothetical protein
MSYSVAAKSIMHIRAMLALPVRHICVCAVVVASLSWYLVFSLFFVLVASVATHQHTELVNQYRDEYFATINPLEKKALLHEIVSRILERGRFLKSNNNASGGGGWDEVDQDRAILKTAHAIQYQRRKSVEHNAVVHGHIQRPETPVRSSQSGRRAAPTTTRPEGPFVSVPHTVTPPPPTMRTTPNAVSSWGNDLLLEPHAVVYRQGANNTVSTTARELFWTTTMTTTPSSPSKDWKQSPTVGYPQYTSSSSNISSSSSRPQTTTITLRDACFLPQQQQQQQQQHQERWWWYHSNPRRTCPAAEPVGSRHHGGSRTEVVASSNDVKQPLCFDPCVIRSLDKVLAFDDSHVTDDARLCGNPFDEESMDGRNENDDDVSSIGSFNGDNDALDLSLLGALDMNW